MYADKRAVMVRIEAILSDNKGSQGYPRWKAVRLAVLEGEAKDGDEKGMIACFQTLRLNEPPKICNNALKCWYDVIIVWAGYQVVVSQLTSSIPHPGMFHPYRGGY